MSKLANETLQWSYPALVVSALLLTAVPMADGNTARYRQPLNRLGPVPLRQDSCFLPGAPETEKFLCDVKAQFRSMTPWYLADPIQSTSPAPWKNQTPRRNSDLAE